MTSFLRARTTDLRQPRQHQHRLIGETDVPQHRDRPAPPADVMVPSDLIPLRVLELDLPGPATGWLIELDRGAS